MALFLAVMRMVLTFATLTSFEDLLDRLLDLDLVGSQIATSKTYFLSAVPAMDCSVMTGSDDDIVSALHYANTSSIFATAALSMTSFFAFRMSYTLMTACKRHHATPGMLRAVLTTLR